MEEKVPRFLLPARRQSRVLCQPSSDPMSFVGRKAQLARPIVHGPAGPTQPFCVVTTLQVSHYVIRRRFCAHHIAQNKALLPPPRCEIRTLDEKKTYRNDIVFGTIDHAKEFQNEPRYAIGFTIPLRGSSSRRRNNNLGSSSSNVHGR